MSGPDRLPSPLKLLRDPQPIAAIVKQANATMEDITMFACACSGALSRRAGLCRNVFPTSLHVSLKSRQYKDDFRQLYRLITAVDTSVRPPR